MLQNRRERILLTVVSFGLLGFGWWLIGQPLYDAWMGMDDEIQRQEMVLAGHEKMLLKKPEIEREYEKTQTQLTMKPHESLQIADFRKELDGLIRAVGMEYKDFGQQEKPRETDDFKVLLVEVTEIRATPKQLGTFLYKLENESKVMDIEEMTIANEERGRSRFRRQAGGLTVNMKVARLVEYTTAELKEIRSRRTRIRG